MPWELKGTYVESCSCDLPCPCTVSFDMPADLDYCRVLLAFDIERGVVNGVDVSSIGAALIADSPKLMTDGNWKLGLFIDEAASDEQADALTQVFSGALGGPPAALGPLLGEFLGVTRAAIEFSHSGGTHAVKIGQEVDIEIEDVVPFGSQSGEAAELVNIAHPAGSTLTLARVNHARVDAFGIQYEGHAGLSKSDFAWAG